ncbi:MAG: hypothetical protein QG639_787 [Patescibacteria group bacterium]|nr:hypothetical protein [Patescibacteria group bacterium]
MRKTPEEYTQGAQHALYLTNQPTGTLSDIYPRTVAQNETFKVPVQDYSIHDVFPDQLTAMTFYDENRKINGNPTTMRLKKVEGGYKIDLS